MSQKSSFAIVWHYAFHVKKCILKACVFLCHPVVRYLSARFSRVDVDRVAHEKTLDDLANNAQQWEVYNLIINRISAQKAGTDTSDPLRLFVSGVGSFFCLLNRSTCVALSQVAVARAFL
jgi:hypothetical protein